MASTAGWNVEDRALWDAGAKKIAWRNLWISIPCLLCAFAVWSYWSIITVQMRNLGFPFTAAQLFTLTAVAGLTGATLRIPHSFLVALAGGRNVVAVSTALTCSTPHSSPSAVRRYSFRGRSPIDVRSTRSSPG